MRLPARSRGIGSAVLLSSLLFGPVAQAGPNRLNANGEASLTYTYVLRPASGMTPADAPLTSAEVTSLRTTLEEASRHLCRATDGLIRVNEWVVDPSARLSDADVVAYPRMPGRSYASIVMFDDFLDESTLAHELGHYLLWLPDQYEEQRRGGNAYGIGGAFSEQNSAVSTPLTAINNTMMENQFALRAAGLEFQLSHDGVFDLRRGDDDPNQANDEPYPTAAPTSQITLSSLTLGTTGTPQALDLANVQTAIDTSAARTLFEVIDEGGDVLWRGSGEDRATNAYSWGDTCDFGQGSIRTWMFLEWTGGVNYRLVLAAEDRQFTAGAFTRCEDVQLDTITLRQLAALPITAGTTGCGDGVVSGSEECESSVSPGANPCSVIPGGATSPTATTTCDPATCTWRRAGCYDGSPASCGLLNPDPQQCFPGVLGTLTLAACPSGGGTQSCTDCLDDPSTCPVTLGAPTTVTNNNSAFNVPNTEYSISNRSVGANFSVRLNVQRVTTGAAHRLGDVTVDGAGECAFVAQQGGLCLASGGHSASCEHVCGESFSTYSPPAIPGAFERTDGNRYIHWGADGNNVDLRCTNRDRGQAAPMRPMCERPTDYPLVVSEWDLLQYNLRRRGLNANIQHAGINLGNVGDPLTWGQSPPTIEGVGQDCSAAAYAVNITIRTAFNPSAPGQYDTSLVIDTSGSMATPATQDAMKTRADIATGAGVAALQMLNTAQGASGGMTTYNVGLTSFATTANAVAATVALDMTGLTNLTTALQGLPAPSGNTAIGEGLRVGYGQLNAAAARDRFVMLISDGYHNTGDAPEDVARQLVAADTRLHVCPVYFGESADQSDQLLRVALEGKCALRIADPTTNDIAITMFELAGERAGGSVLMSDRVTVQNRDDGPILLSTILSTLSPATSATTELVVSPEMKNLRLLVSDSGRNSTPWIAPTVTLTAPNGATRVLDASSARFNESARGYRLFELPIRAASEYGTWRMTVAPAANAGTAPAITNLSVVADRSEAQCEVGLDRASYQAGANVDVTVTPRHSAPLNLSTVSSSVAVFGPSLDGTIRRLTVPLRLDASRRVFTGRFPAPSSNGVYSVQALCEAANPVSDIAEQGPFTAPVAITSLPAFRVQGARQFVVKGGSFVCGSPTDCDRDGVPDANEPPGDADGDNIPNANESDSDDDGRLDGAEQAQDADADGVSDIVDADMNNDGRPDYLTAACAFPTAGANASRSGASPCRGSTAADARWTNTQRRTPGDGVTLDEHGTAYINATTGFLLQQSVVAVNPNGSVKWTAPMTIAASTPVEVVEAANLVVVGDIAGRVVALNGTGGVAWRHETRFPIRGVVARDGRVYVSTWLGGLYALDAFTGRRLWQQTSLIVPWGVPSISPDGTTLYVAYGASLVAVDTASGAVRWSRLFPMTFMNSLTVGANGDIYMGALDNALYRFSGSTGAQIWRYALAGSVIGQPVVEGTNIYFGSNNDRVYALRDGASPALLWSTNLGSDVVGWPVRSADGTIYAGTSLGRIYGLNGTNGSIVWQKSAPSRIGSIIAIGDGRTVFTDSSGRLYSY